MDHSRRTLLLGGAALAVLLGFGIRGGAGASGKPLITVYKEPT